MKDHLIIKIDLSKHTQYFSSDENTFDDADSILKFIDYEVLKLDNDLERTVLKEVCTNIGNSHIIFDGVDGIAPENYDKMFKAIQQLQKLKVSGLYISARPHLGQRLEETLENFRHEFVTLSREDQIEYLTKYWGPKEKICRNII